ncbi:MAG: Phage-related minor tail protein [Methanobacterium sp. Maddingley MBC34]|nr:MAG: Phage-related minor tail protein [Methanobacterium sp. Maddingley MBC34]
MDTELGILVKGDISDIESNLKNLENDLSSLKDVLINVDTEINTGELDALQTELQTLDDTAISPEVSSTGLTDVKEEATSAKEEIAGMGDEADATSDLIIGGMALAAAAIFEVAGEAEDAAQSLNDMSFSYYKLGSSFSGGESELRDQIAAITDARFPEDEALSYISLLKRLGVAQEDLVDSATDLNEIRVATGSSAEDMTPLLQGLKAMNVDISNLEDSYDALYYANAKYVGGLPAFSTDLRRFSSDFAELGLSADQAAVILVAAQNKWPDPRKRRTELKKAIEESNGDLSLLEQKLGVTGGSITNASDITGQYAGKVEDASQKSRDLATDTQKVGSWIDDLKIKFGGVLGPMLSFVGLLGKGAALVTGLWAGLKAGMKLGDWDTDWAKKLIEDPIRTSINKVKGFNLDDFWERLKGPTKGSYWDQIRKMGAEDYLKYMEEEEGRISTMWEKLNDGMLKGSKKIKIPETNLMSGLDDSFAKMNIRSDLKGSQVSESIGKGFIKGIPRAVDSIAIGAVLLIDGLANYTEALKDPLGHMFGPLAEVIPQPIRNILSPYNMMKMMVGEGKTEEFFAWAKVMIEDPMKGAIDQTWDDLVWFFTELPGDAYVWGKNIIDSWAKGITDNLNNAKSWLEGALGNLMKVLKGESPPVEGPLKDIDSWGLNVGKAYVDGMSEGMNDLSVLNRALKVDMLRNIPSPSTSTNSTATTHITVDLAGANIASNLDATTVGEKVGSGLASKIMQQASNAGVSVINGRR